ncbi:hypothetical protein Q3A66_00415 [Hymenobacter sp. BT770]|uniref:hypothetical protein n=1 Tax=Hymenobacter sp. BT770 TaxID=2886942 RepID=UPI001D1049BE|nr:hypothetical protein [Hymenobacter sp. BT770]MCC3151868.1 hypothetical protein [Hymenobacter sp. BT770]MDO3413510.1 hypothetical protein [Hymenobacter sp. BT770]
MKKLAILPAFLVLLAGASSCEKNQVEPTQPTISAADATLDALTQGKTVTSTNTGTYPYTYQVVENGITVTKNATGTFTSALRITSFEVRNGVITAIGTLSATPTSGPASAYGPVAVAIPLSLAQISSSCSGAQVNYGTQTVSLNGTTQSVNPVLSVSPSQSDKNLLGNLVCSLGKILGNPSPSDTGGVVSHLNKIISIIGS